MLISGSTSSTCSPSGRGDSVVKPSLYWRTNVYGTRVLLDAITENGVPTLVSPSTAATYGEPESVPITEDAPTRPTNTYGATKLVVDMMITGESAATDLAAVSLRYFNVAGAAFGAGERHVVETHLIGRAEGSGTGDAAMTPDDQASGRIARSSWCRRAMTAAPLAHSVKLNGAISMGTSGNVQC